MVGSKAQLYFDPFETAQPEDETDILESLKRFKRFLTEKPEFVLTVPNPLIALRTSA